jgi:hypothetical protein
MSHWTRAVVAAAAGSLVLAAPAVAARPPAKVGTKINVKQGSIGALKLGIPASKARSLLGRPDDQDKQGFSGKSYNLTLSYKRYGLRLSFWQGTQGGKPKLSTITITSPQYSQNGARVGATVQQVQRALGSSVQCISTKGKATPFCQVPRRGGDVTFQLKRNRVTSIRIGS